MSKAVKRSYLKQQLWKVSLAQRSAEQVQSFCEHFITSKPDPTSPLFSSLLTSICVVYAKPFTNNSQVGMLSKKFARYSSPGLQRLHESLLNFRDNFYAHQNPVGRKLHVRVEAEDLGEQIQYKFYPQAEVSHLNPARIPDVLNMCKELWKTLDVKFYDLMDQLYGKRHWPTGKFTLNLNDES
jgi:hypothetical protein